MTTHITRGSFNRLRNGNAGLLFLESTCSCGSCFTDQLLIRSGDVVICDAPMGIWIFPDATLPAMTIVTDRIRSKGFTAEGMVDFFSHEQWKSSCYRNGWATAKAVIPI